MKQAAVAGLIGLVIGVGLTLLFTTYSSSLFDRSGSSHSITPSQTDTQFTTTEPAPDRIVTDTSDLAELTETENNFERDAQLYSLLATSSESELNKLLDRTKDISLRSRRLSTRAAIFRRYTMINPNEALRLVSNFPTSEQNALLVGVFQEWSLLDLSDAIAAATQLDQRFKKIAVETILLVRSDLSEHQQLDIGRQMGTVDLVERLNLEELLTNADSYQSAYQTVLDSGISVHESHHLLTEIAKTWVEEEGFGVLDRISRRMEDIEEDEWMLDYLVLNAVVSADPQAAFEYARQQPESNDFAHNRILGSAADAWARVDPAAAMEAVSSLKDRSNQEALQFKVVGRWARSDPDELLRQIDQIKDLTGAPRLRAMETAIGEIARKSPQRAIQKMREYEAQGNNVSTIESALVRAWCEEEPLAALDWVLAEVDKENTQYDLLMQSTLVAVAAVNPRRAMEVALEQPLTRWGGAMEMFVISTITNQDVEEAISWLPKIREESRLQAYMNVGRTLIQKGQTKRALDMSRDIPEGHERETFQRNLISTWYYSDSETLMDSLTSLGSDLRALAAFEILQSQFWQPTLSDAETQNLRQYLNAEYAEQLQQIEESRY